MLYPWVFLDDRDSNTEEEEKKRISKSNKEDKGVLARSIDEDSTLPPSVLLFTDRFPHKFESIYLQLNSICMSVALNTGTAGALTDRIRPHDRLGTT